LFFFLGIETEEGGLLGMSFGISKSEFEPGKKTINNKLTRRRIISYSLQ